VDIDKIFQESNIIHLDRNNKDHLVLLERLYEMYLSLSKGLNLIN